MSNKILITEALQNEDQPVITDLDKIIFSEAVTADISNIEKLIFLALSSYGVIPVIQP